MGTRASSSHLLVNLSHNPLTTIEDSYLFKLPALKNLFIPIEEQLKIKKEAQGAPFDFCCIGDPQFSI